MPKSPEELAHQEWLGYVQPVGLVVSIPAMLEAQCYVNKNIMAEHTRFLNCLPREKPDEPIPEIRDLAEFTQKVLDWEAEDLVEVPPRSALTGEMASLEVVLPQYHETLRPTHVVWEWNDGGSGNSAQSPTLLVQEHPSGTDLDAASETDSAKHWNAAPQAKFERLLRETGVPIGLLSNRRQLRLVYAPKGESSGHATFNVDEMMQVAGRPMFAALHMLLRADRMFSLGDNQRLPAILANSRKYQNTVSTKLAEQVLAALYELMRGFQAANDVRNGDLLRDVLASDPNHVYSGLLTVLMRLVFVMYAEDRDLLSSDPIYSNYYSVTGLFNRLREDAGRHPDTMNQRFGAWSQLITLFRLIYEGGQHGDFQLPARKGYLFDPERYPFLEGRVSGFGVRDSRGTYHDTAILSGSSSLADGDGSDSSCLRSDEGVSEGRTLQSDEPDTTSGDLNSDEHRGGLREGKKGISAVSENRSGEPDGTGNPFDDRPEDRNPQSGRSHSTPRNDRSPGAHADKTATGTSGLTPSLNPEPQTPRVSDATVYNVLRNLLILDGERLSYRTLDVEQIGSVYETVMGFNLEVAQGKSIAIKPVKTHGAPATINLEELLATKEKDRAKWLKDHSDQKVTGAALKELKEAKSIDDLLAALDKKIAKKVTPRIVPKGAIVLQPSDERRRSGSHYTPRSLTEPIVRTTLEPILKQLCEPVGDRGLGIGIRDETNPEPPTPNPKLEEARAAAIAKGVPHPRQILDLKICDPAMGSGAFLVETCRQLADHLVESWAAHAESLTPNPQTLIPPDEDELLYARRLIAQRCLYGVDKNPMAVDLAKLSLWLVTLAKDHPFTFLDHSLRHGDSLVGLTRRQIIGFHWEPKKQKDIEGSIIEARLERATEERRKILDAREDTPYRDQEQRLAAADEALSVVRLIGDACVSAFFAGKKKKDRETRVDQLFGSLSEWFASGMSPERRGPIAEAAASLPQGKRPIPPLHWEIEFPEVFSRVNGGFDSFIGNPPFLSGADIWPTFGGSYRDYLRVIHENSGGKAVDLVAHFYRRAFGLLRNAGTFGLIATNTICQGDTREAGLRYLCHHGGIVYAATRRMAWPGIAAVVVSVVHVSKFARHQVFRLDGKDVRGINSFLLASSSEASVERLRANVGKSFRGHVILGMGFTFDDEAGSGSHSPLARMHAAIEQDPRNSERIFPYIGGAEINRSPAQSYHRYVISFGTLSQEEAEAWPELMDIVRERVLPERKKIGGYSVAESRRERWWQFGTYATALQEALAFLNRCLVLSRVSPNHAVVFQPTDRIFADSLVVFAMQTYAEFCVLQSRPHEIWARFLGSSMKDDLRYTSSDCFDTFPLPLYCNSNTSLESVGHEYYMRRTEVLRRGNFGLTHFYNRFHDPHEKSAEIQRLRDQHDAMDRTVLAAYGWHDLAEQARCEFLLDYEEDDAEESGGKKSKRKKPWRLRWPDDFRDEVLARLLELNQQRHQEELLLAKQDAPAEKKRKSRPVRTSDRSTEKNDDRQLF